jgi:hypothetical protein
VVRYQELDDLEAALLTVWVRAGLWLQPDVASRLLVGLGFGGLHGGGSRSAHCGAIWEPCAGPEGRAWAVQGPPPVLSTCTDARNRFAAAKARIPAAGRHATRSNM